MLSKRHTPEQVITKIAEGDQMLNEGKTIAEVARSFGITETTWYRCKSTYGGMKANDAKRLKELEAENRRLKIMVADLTLDKAMLKELAEGNF
ncbi:transposase [Ferrimicrobium acidiphilum]|uniref:transposase n=1 Tax=Ferrimicrobium acidiphilum TaxID=121039 RepID=UPI003C6D23DB